MTDTIRVYDLAKELNLSNKDVIEKLEKKLGVKVKSHSSVISATQAKKLKELLSTPKSEQNKKPKAFVVKKLNLQKSKMSQRLKKNLSKKKLKNRLKK